MNRSPSSAKGLKAGDWVEVLSKEEILATLDEHGRFENLLFMPEMFQYCGRRLRVFKRADKTCDPAHEPWSIRRVTNCVHLDESRCDGECHGGCQAGCLIFWKEAWLKRAETTAVVQIALDNGNADPGGRMTEKVWIASQKVDAEGTTIYSCQATELRRFTEAMSPWDPRQYIRDLWSGNLSTGLARDSRWGRLLELILATMRLVYVLAISAASRYIAYPSITGGHEKIPVDILDLSPGELVQVRSKDEIMATLDKNHRHRGLLFDGEMLPYCGGIYRVLRRVHHIIDEKTGKMVNMKYPCIILEGVVCRSDFHRICPRAIYPYWRENWLKRAIIPQLSATPESILEVCDK